MYLITDEQLYLELRDVMAQVRDAAANGLTNAAVRRLISHVPTAKDTYAGFLQRVHAAAVAGTIRQGLARGRSDATHYNGPYEKGLLSHNATLLLAHYPNN